MDYLHDRPAARRTARMGASGTGRGALPADRRSGPATLGSLLHAILAHLYLAWIHPFGDGNGRTARLVEFMLLARSGVPAPAAHLLSNHYNQTRTEYYRQLDRSSRANAGSGDPMESFATPCRDSSTACDEQCAYVGRVQLGIAWEHLVYETFHAEPPTAAHARRRTLLLALGNRRASRAEVGDPRPHARTRPQLRHTDRKDPDPRPELAPRTATVLRTAQGYRARMERMRSFQPGTARA